MTKKNKDMIIKNNYNLASGVVTINLTSIQNNYKKIKQFYSKFNKNIIISAVVKANSYGLGMIQISKALYEIGCRIYYVANPEEGLNLRMKFDNISIYILNGLFKNTENIYQKYNLIPCLSTIEQIISWINWGYKINKQLPCVIHFNTGINRLGIELNEYKNNHFKILNIDHILSHFASADNPLDIQNIEQIKKFNLIKQYLPKYKISFANSAAIALKCLQNLKNKNSTILRTGIAIFGVKTITNYPINLESIITISARILQILNLKIGDKIGYNHYYVCNKNIKAAVIAAGYADGLSYALSKTNGYFYFNKYKLPILGKISMDMTVVDISSVPENILNNDNFIEIIGKNISLEMIAKWSNTITYEILTNIGKRFQKKYIR